MKVCSCRRRYTLKAWRALEYVGRQGEAPYELELRNCVCGSTISLPTRKLMANKRKDLRLLAVKFNAQGDMEMLDKTISQNDLKAMQNLVGGYIERISVPALGMDMWVNEEGLLQQLPLHKTPFCPHPIAGNFFFTRHTSSGNLKSLDNADVADLKHILVHGWEE